LPLRSGKEVPLQSFQFLPKVKRMKAKGRKKVAFGFALGFILLSLGRIEAALAQKQMQKQAQKRVLKFRVPSDPITLDWHRASGASETFVLMNVMQGLVQEDGNLRPAPALAERWQTSEDGKVWNFWIRESVRWSDGRPLLAQHFKDSWLRLLDRKTKSPYADFLDDIMGAAEFRTGKASAADVGIAVKGPLQLEVKLKQPSPWFLHLLSFWPTFPVRLDRIQGMSRQQVAPQQWITLGPWRLQSWKKGRALALERNPQFAGAGGASEAETHLLFDEVQMQIEPSDERARQDFYSRKTDFLLNATTSDLLRRVEHKYRVEQFTYLATTYLAFLVDRPQMKSTDLRKALALAIEPEAIPKLLQGGQRVGRGWVPPGIDGHESAISLRGSLHESRSALVRAGYPEGEGLPPLRLSVRNFDGAEKLADHLGQLWKERLGVEIQVEVNTAGDHQKLIEQRQVDLAVQHWGADFPDPSNFFDVFRSGAPTNRPGWSNAQYDEWIKQARHEADHRKRMELYQKAERLLLIEETVIYPLFYPKTAVLLNERIQSLKISPLNYLFFDKILAAPGSNQ
jgi:oligopeptide transport system substrate-binding protein